MVMKEDALDKQRFEQTFKIVKESIENKQNFLGGFSSSPQKC